VGFEITQLVVKSGFLHNGNDKLAQLFLYFSINAIIQACDSSKTRRSSPHAYFSFVRGTSVCMFSESRLLCSWAALVSAS
jgi:hypothetical protein